MLVGLVDVDSKIPNLALCKISAYYKEKGDTVEWYNSLTSNPDIIYASKIFNFTEDFKYYPSGVEIIKGGTGYDLSVKLPEEIENMRPDYSIYPDCDYVLGFCTRGCLRSCKFCYVPKKEGKIRIVGDIYDIWDGKSKKIMLLDNNLTAAPEHLEKVCNQLIKEKLVTDFSQGLDIRLMKPWMAPLLNKVRLWKQIHFAFDDIKLEKTLLKQIDMLVENGLKTHKMMFYVLIGFNSTPEEDMRRIMILDSVGADAYVMPYNVKDPYQRRLTTWSNGRYSFKTISWKEYVEGTKRKGGCGVCGESPKKYYQSNMTTRKLCIDCAEKYLPKSVIEKFYDLVVAESEGLDLAQDKQRSLF